MEKNKVKHKGLAWKIPLYTILGLITTIAITWGSLNGAKYAIYKDFYNNREVINDIPGLNDGFTPQGICVDEVNKVTYMTGYQNNTTEASRIYIVGKDYAPRYVEILNPDGTIFTGHNGGMCYVNNNMLLIADTDKGIHFIDTTGILNKDVKQVKIIKTVTLENNEADFIFSNDNYIIIGEFAFNEKGFPCNNKYQTSDGEYTAIAEQYDLTSFINQTELIKPVKAYSIQDKVQGLAMDKDGNIVLSTSYGVADSILYKYNTTDFHHSELKYKDTVDLIYLDKYSSTLKAPAMTEDLDYSYDEASQTERYITYTEAACDKYFFGKLFFANYYFTFTM